MSAEQAFTARYCDDLWVDFRDVVEAYRDLISNIEQPTDDDVMRSFDSAYESVLFDMVSASASEYESETE